MLRVNCNTRFGAFHYPHVPKDERTIMLFLDLVKYNFVIRKEDLDNGNISIIEDFRRNSQLNKIRINVKEGTYVARVSKEDFINSSYSASVANYEIVPHSVLTLSKFKETEDKSSFFTNSTAHIWALATVPNFDHIEGEKIVLDYNINYGVGRQYLRESYERTINELFKSGEAIHTLLDLSVIKDSVVDNHGTGWLTVNIGSSYWGDTGTFYYVLDDNIVVKEGANKNPTANSLVPADYFADVYVSANAWGVNAYVKSIDVLLKNLTDVVTPIIIKDEDVVEFVNSYYGSGVWDDLQATEAWLTFIRKHMTDTDPVNKFIVMGDTLLSLPNGDEAGFSYSMLYSLNATPRIFDALKPEVKIIVENQYDIPF